MLKEFADRLPPDLDAPNVLFLPEGHRLLHLILFERLETGGPEPPTLARREPGATISDPGLKDSLNRPRLERGRPAMTSADGSRRGGRPTVY
jgi:hypothetical protein